MRVYLLSHNLKREKTKDFHGPAQRSSWRVPSECLQAVCRSSSPVRPGMQRASSQQLHMVAYYFVDPLHFHILWCREHIVKCVEYSAAAGSGSRLQPLAAVKCRSHSWARISEKNHRALLALRGAMSTHAVEQFAEQVHGMAAVCGNLPALRGGGNEDARNGSAVDCQNAAHIQSGDEGQEYPGRLLPLKSTCCICPEAGTRVPRRVRSPDPFLQPCILCYGNMRV